MLDNVSGCYHELKVAEKISKRDVKITNVLVKSSGTRGRLFSSISKKE